MEAFGRVVLYREHNAIVAGIADPEVRRQLHTWPAWRIEDKGDYSLVLLPWAAETCRLLDNVGLHEAVECAPMLFDPHMPLVEGKHKPLKHQALTAAFMTLHPRCYVLSEPRMGKTGSVILACDYMQRSRQITGAVCIITTFTTVYPVWKRSIEETLPGIEVEVVHGPTRSESLKKTPSFFVTNYDSVRLAEKDFMEALQDGRIGAIIVDELTHVGNSETQRSKAIGKLCRHPNARMVVGMTGSPADNPEATFGMGKCINAGKLPCTTKSAWTNMVYYQWGDKSWKRTLRPDAPEVIRRALQPSIRYKKADVLDLPPVTEQIRDCPLTAEQQELISHLEVESMALLKSGEAITAANGGVLLQRVLQIALGCIKDEQGRPVRVDHHYRTQTILEAVAESTYKTVIFSPYVEGCNMLAEECRKAGYTTGVITGAVSGTKRAAILKAFQETKDPHILVCHPTTVGFGTELSAADTMIFAVPLLLGGFTYNQALERLSSVKQKAKNINIIHILSCQAERKVLNNLQQGHSTGRTVAALFEKPEFL